MSIHQRRIFGPRPQFTHNTMDSRKRRHHAPPYQPPIRWFFGGICGTPTEKKLVEMMNQRRSA